VWSGNGIVSKRCVSDSGLSIYDIDLDTTNRNGEIRYRFMGQDIFYIAHLERVENEFIQGVATFKESRTGESKGNPFSFTYDYERNTFIESNTVKKCN
jgi:hypothetical protein